MNFLKDYNLNENEIEKIKNNYPKSLISSIIYKKENVINMLNFFKEKEFDIKKILFNRLDLFLIDYKILKDKINKYNNIDIISALKEDISLIDNL